jgi:hypothetical protein
MMGIRHQGPHMHTLEEEFRDSDDDWLGVAAAQDRKDGDSIRAYLQHHAKLVPPRHVIVGMTMLMSSSRMPKGTKAPCLVVRHFDPGDSSDPQRTFRNGLEDGTVELKETVIQCGYDVFLAFSDFTIDLTARGYGAEPPKES